jgi:hypothetical protein
VEGCEVNFDCLFLVVVVVDGGGGIETNKFGH